MLQRVLNPRTLSQIAKRSAVVPPRICISKRGSDRQKIFARPTAILRSKLMCPPTLCQTMAFCTQKSLERQGYLQMAPEIMQEIDDSMKTIHSVIAKSNDIAAQQQIIHALVKKPLPLSNDATRWKPFYFDDMIDSNVYQSFKSLVEKSNRVTGQQAFLIDIIQGSGSGKSHLGLTYSRHEGCLPILFTKDCHFNLITIASDFLQSIYPSSEIWKNNEVLSFAQEEIFLRQSIQVMQLIPLTFIQFAGIFLRSQRVPPPETANGAKYDALVRAITSSCIPVIEKMYKENLKHFLAIPASNYWQFFKAMVALAKELGMKAVFYDEIAPLQHLFQGKFLHIGNLVHPSYRLERLKAERRLAYMLQVKRDAAPAAKSATLKQVTSLLYLLHIAMEDFAREGVAQIATSTSHSSTRVHFIEDYARQRLVTRDFVLHEEPIQRLERFKKLFKEAFGDEVEVIMEEEENTKKLHNLASHALHLFGGLGEILPTYPNDLASFVKEYLTAAEARAKATAGATNAGHHTFSKPKQTRRK